MTSLADGERDWVRFASRRLFIPKHGIITKSNEMTIKSRDEQVYIGLAYNCFGHTVLIHAKGMYVEFVRAFMK